MRILVTGGAGFIGANFVAHLLAGAGNGERRALPALAGQRSGLGRHLAEPADPALVAGGELAPAVHRRMPEHHGP